MGTPFLISLREGLEMALIVAIILAYLGKTGNRSQYKHVWFGVFLAAAVSLIAGSIIFSISGKLSGTAHQLFEGIANLTAVAILTWMIFWMRKASRNIKRELETRVGSTLDTGSRIALTLLVFIAVVREGLEEVLFIFSTSQSSTAVQSSVGVLLGFAVAIGLGYTFYVGSRMLNLSLFFNATSIVLILIAAGLFAHGLHEFIEAGLIPPLIAHVWDTNSILSENGGIGSFLKTIFGYNGNPSLIEAIAYIGYLVGSLSAFAKPLVFTKTKEVSSSVSTP